MNYKLNEKIKSGDDFSTIQKIAFDSRRSTVISFLNPFSYYEVSREPSLVTDIDYFFSDGSLLCIMHNLFLPKITRASFDYSSIAEDFLLESQAQNKRVAIIGATQQENEIAVKVLEQQFSSLNVVYQRSGYIEDSAKAINELNTVKPNVIIVGMGTPYQERFAISLKDQLNLPATIITCGGFLTQTSIKADYYHPLIKKLGLRWLQRMIMHKHVRERVFKKYPKFVICYLNSMIRQKIAKR